MQKSAILIPYSVQIAKYVCNLNTLKRFAWRISARALRAFKRLGNVNARCTHARQRHRSREGGHKGYVPPEFCRKLSLSGGAPFQDCYGQTEYCLDLLLFTLRLWYDNLSSHFALQEITHLSKFIPFSALYHFQYCSKFDAWVPFLLKSVPASVVSLQV